MVLHVSLSSLTTAICFLSSCHFLSISSIFCSCFFKSSFLFSVNLFVTTFFKVLSLDLDFQNLSFILYYSICCCRWASILLNSDTSLIGMPNAFSFRAFISSCLSVFINKFDSSNLNEQYWAWPWMASKSLTLLSIVWFWVVREPFSLKKISSSTSCCFSSKNCQEIGKIGEGWASSSFLILSFFLQYG